MTRNENRLTGLHCGPSTEPCGADEITGMWSKCTLLLLGETVWGVVATPLRKTRVKYN